MGLHCHGHRARLRVALLGTSALVAASFACSVPLHAQSTWQGTTGAYGTAANWDNNTPPTGAGQSAIFADTGVTTINVGSPVSPDDWTFAGNAQSYTIGGAAIAFGGAGIVNGAASGTITIANTLSGGGVQQLGASTLLLTGTGSNVSSVQLFGGTLAITQGGSVTSLDGLVGFAGNAAALVTGTGSTWNVTNSLLLGVAGGTGTLTIADGGTVTVASPNVAAISVGSTLKLGDGALAGSIVVDQINHDGEIVANFTDTSTLAANLIGTGSITKSGTGNLILSGTTSDYTGDTTVLGGTLTTTNGGALGNSTAKFSDGTTLRLDGSFGFTNTVWVVGNVNIDVTTGNTAFALGDITDGTSAGGFTKTGLGTLVFSGTNKTYSGATNVDAGTLQIDPTSALPQTTDMKVNAGATLVISDTVFADINSLANGTSGGGNVVIGPTDPSTALFIGFAGGATTTFGGSITGLGSLGIDGGSLTLTGTSNIGGDLVVCACSTLTISGPGASFNAAGSGTLTFFVPAGTEVDGTLNVLNGATFTTSNLGVNGTMTVDGANTTATVSGVTLVGSGATAANLTISGGAVMNSQLGAIIGNPTENAAVTVTGQNSVWNVGGVLSVGDSLFSAGPGYLTIAAGGVVNVTGLTAIAADPLLNRGPSILSVTGNGSALNTVDLEIGASSCGCGDFPGTLTIADGGKVTVTGTTYIAPLGILNLGIGGLAGSIVAPTIINDGQINANFTDTLTLAASISGTGSLTKSGSGTLMLTADNSYTGATTVNGGLLVVGNGGATGAVTGNVTANAGGTFGVNRSDVYVLPNLVTGAGNFAQLGPGTTVLGLNGMNYTGTTTIAAGVLQVGQGGSDGSIGTGDIINNATLAINKSGNFTLPNNITGSGIFNQIGTGTTVLTGTSTYSGATNVSAGVLQGGAANTFSPNSTHNVAAGATLDLNNFNQIIGALSGAGPVTLGSAVLTTGGNNASTAYSGDISGTGGLTKAGTGTFTLSGISSYTGPTTVAAGTLSVNGAIASSAVTVNGGTLSGTGTVGSTTVNAGGALSPGNSIGTISISGNLNFVGAGNYLVEVSPAAADRTNASGSATLSGILQAIGTGGVYTIGTRYTVINANSGVSGTFGKLAISGNFGVTKPRIDYDGNNVYLVLDPNSVASVLVNPTSDQRSIAGAIDAAIAAGSTAAPFAALFALPVAQIPAALDQLTGEVHASTAGVLVDESLYVRSAVLGRLRQASYGGDAGMASLSLGGPQTSFQDEAFTTLLAYGGKSLPVKAPMRAPQASPDVVFWAQGLGAWGRFDGDGNTASVRRDLAGFFTGVDTRVGANGRAGIAAGYTGSKNVLNGRGSANVDTGHIAAYGGWSFGALNLRAGGAYAFHTIDTDRTINFTGFFDRAFAHYQGNTGQVFGELGYGFNFANVAVEPFAGGAWVRLSTDATAERGGLAALNVGGTTFEVGYSTLGIRAASIVPLAHNMMLVPRVSLAWQHAFGSVTPEATLAFQVAPVPFAISGVPIARDSLLAEAGVDLAIGAHATLGVSYTGQIARNVTDHAAKGKFSWKF